jgi:hypothetical protein
LRFDAPLGGFAAGSYFDAMTLLAESNLQQLADRLLIVNHQQVGH